MRTRIKRYILKFWFFITLAALFMALGVAYWVVEIYSHNPEPIKTQGKEVPKPREDTPKPLPESHVLAVPYTVQAPFAKWSVHEESCEEAAILMYNQHLIDPSPTNIAPEVADLELNKMRDWQIKNWGPEKDLSIKELGDLAKGYFGLMPTAHEATEQKIKELIVSGKPVLVPVMTHSLKNPHYSPKNTYHILLIKGYDKNGVITNDAGIKAGRDWHYSWEVLWGAIDAQTPKMSQGRSLLVLEK